MKQVIISNKLIPFIYNYMSDILVSILKMSTKNFIIEVIEGAENKRYFIVRELMPGNVPPTTQLVTDSAEEVAQFFDTVKV